MQRLLYKALICSNGGFLHAVAQRLGSGIGLGHLKRDKRSVEGEMIVGDLPRVVQLDMVFGEFAGFNLGGLGSIAFFIIYKPL